MKGTFISVCENVRKKTTILFILIAMAFLMNGASVSAAGETAVPDADWTVLIYLCGSDLETRDGMASYNLHEIMSCEQPSYTTKLNEETHVFERTELEPEVNVVVETGGAKEWHNDEENAPWGLEIASDRLQRYVLSHDKNEEGFYPLVFQEEQPLASMADPETLTDFILWGTRYYPAEKYMLVLWDHGNGSLGLIMDDQFEGDTLYLHELGDALSVTDVHFEAVLMDACMMANLEAAQTLSPYADWMIASEELVSGYGSAFRQWLHALFQNPGCDGEKIGCLICDTTEAKYASLEEPHASLQLTWSVIDLKEIDRVTQQTDRLYSFLCDMYEYDPRILADSLEALLGSSDRFGTGRKFMRDLSTSLDDGTVVKYIDKDILNDLSNALDDAAEYTVNGQLHSEASGISRGVFSDMTDAQREVYVKCCRSAPYLALMDAVLADWEAPDWVYDKTRRLPEIGTIPFLSEKPELVIEDDLPRIRGNCNDAALQRCTYELYREDEDTGTLIKLGSDKASFTWIDEEAGVYEYTMDRPGTWPKLEGELCTIEYQGEFDADEYNLGEPDVSLYDIPVQMGSDQMNLRVGFWCENKDTGDAEYNYIVYGLAHGYDGSIGAPTRFVDPLSSLQGQEYRLLYPVYTEDPDSGQTEYEIGDPLTMYRYLELKEKPLPEGTYYCVFVLEDCFFRDTRMDMVRLYYDGNAFMVQED